MTKVSIYICGGLFSFSVLLTSAQAKRVRNFTATQDANGNQHPATTDVNANGVIKCTSATGRNPRQYPLPTCSVLGKNLKPGETASTGPGGTMTLTCNGQGALWCRVEVTD